MKYHSLLLFLFEVVFEDFIQTNTVWFDEPFQLSVVQRTDLNIIKLFIKLKRHHTGSVSSVLSQVLHLSLYFYMKMGRVPDREKTPYECKNVHLFKAVVQQGELLVPPHHRRSQRVLSEATLRLLVHEQKLSTSAVPFRVLVAGKTAFRVKVAFLICVLPLVIIIVTVSSITGYTNTNNYNRI